MKRTSLFIYVMVAALTVLLSSACNTNLGSAVPFSGKTKSEVCLAEQVSTAVDKMAQSYGRLDELTFQDSFDNALNGVLSNCYVGYEPTNLVDTLVRKKINILNLYRQAFKEYALLSDEGFTGKQNAFSQCCLNIQNELTSLGDSASIVYAKAIGTHLKSTRYDQNDVAKILLVALEEIWARDTKQAQSVVNNNFIQYQSAVEAVPDNAFSEEKLTKYVYQPYEGKHNLVMAYKLNLIKSRREDLKTFVNNQDNISSAVHYLVCALTEFLKKGTDKDAVTNYLNRAELLLGSISEEKVKE
ncbi:MAG: hypothetical protein IKR41_05930 [Bacteroidales bacterium]|nr:hypothetical protein [Bacteroidales bacterium]